MVMNFLTLFFLLGLSLTITEVSGIWPNPSTISIQTTTNIKLSLCNIKLIKTSPTGNFIGAPNCMIDGAFSRALKLYRKVSSCTPANTPTIVNLIVNNPSKTNVNPAQDSIDTEAYNIQISSSGTVTISAENTIGAIRSAWTLFQIPRKSRTSAATGQFVLNPVTISDKPQFPYRSLMIDTTRSISETVTERHSIQRLYEIIDKMEIIKFNVLHWHLTDTDGISFQFSNMSAFEPYSIYSDLKRLTLYALLRGIAVIPEIDMVGHSGQVWADQTGMPDFVAPDCPKQLNLDSPKAVDFVVDLFGYVSVGIFINSPTIAFGNDEVAPCGNTYRQSFKILNDRVNQIATNIGKTVLIWADTILDQNISFNTKNTIVAPWKISETGKWSSYSDQLNYLASLGYKVVNVNNDPWYIGWSTTEKTLYNYNPIQGVDGKYIGNVLGGSVALWEPSLEDLEGQHVLWPKSASVAEILWSQISFTSGNGFNQARFNAISTWINEVETDYTNPLCN